MKTRPVITVLTLAAALGFTGCMGPTKTGKEARENARTRLDTYSAKFTYDQAMQDFQVGQFDRALGLIDECIAVLPEAPAYHVLKGRILLEKNRLDQAIDSFYAAIAVDNEYAEAHYFAGIIYQRWSNDEQAFEHYRAAYDAGPDHVHYLLATVEAMIALNQLDEAEELVVSKMAYFEHNASMRHLLGQISLLKGNARKAAKLYEEARLLQPDDDALLEELAWVQYEARMFGVCHETIEAVRSRLDESRPDLDHLDARCLTLVGRSNEAHRLYMSLTKNSPSNTSIWIEFGTLAWELGDFRRVAQCSARVIELAPERFEGYMLQGLYERQQQNFDEAIDLFNTAVALTDTTVLPHLLLGRTSEQAGDMVGALAAYSSALDLDPTNGDARLLHEQLAQSMQMASVETD